MQKNQFKTADQKIWTLALTFGKCRRLKNSLGVDLIDAKNAGGISDLLADRATLASVLWEVAGDGSDAEAFYDLLDGDALADGWGALAEAYINFCPSPQRVGVRLAIEKQAEAMDKAATEIAAVLMSAETTTAIDEAIAELAIEARSTIQTIGKRR
jgi:hypothetical protein